EEQQLANVTLRQANLFEDDLGTFDLAHLRFMFAPIGRDAELRERALALVKPGGVLVVQEPDSATWNMLPPHPRFEELKRVILEAFRLGGGDFDAGRRTFALLRDAGLRDVQIRAAVHALQDAHPYMRVALQFAASLRPRITRFLSESELDALVADVEQLVSAEGNAALTFTVTQVWGQVPV
ncbi:MAG TPA: hypothetical protein VF698_18330, partial [Thermoanaerobaculia bacterium]